MKPEHLTRISYLGGQRDHMPRPRIYSLHGGPDIPVAPTRGVLQDYTGTHQLQGVLKLLFDRYIMLHVHIMCMYIFPEILMN